MIKNYFQFQSVTKSYIATLLKQIDIDKATGVDKIPPKLVKLSANFVCTPYETNNDSLSGGIFPDAAKKATVSLTIKTAFLIRPVIY